MRAVILRWDEVNDLEIYRYVLDALGVKEIDYIKPDTVSSFNIFDGPGDLFFGTVYHSYSEFKREWFPSVNKLILYAHFDNQFRNTDVLSVQPIHEVGAPEIIHAPYAVRPFFKKQVEGLIERKTPGDVAWIGHEIYPMCHSQEFGHVWGRKSYLDRFQEAVKDRFDFIRLGNIHTMRRYARLMMRAKIALHIHGHAEHCFRFYESMYLNRCVVAQRFTHEKSWADLKDVVPIFDTPEEGANLCADLIASGAWIDMRQRQQEWFADNHNEATYFQWGKMAVERLLNQASP